MVNPVPGKAVTTPYHKTGQYWKACGWHTGQDYAAPWGTKVVAARSGTVRHTSYGQAFGSKQMAVVCPDGSEDFYAHMSQRLAAGTKVEAGDRIGQVGEEGNTTGPHLHFERHKRAGRWACDNMDDPMKSHNAGGTVSIAPGDVYLSKLKYGQKDSDSVKRLQVALNSHKLQGGHNIVESGDYGDQTDVEVRLCQDQHLPPADPVKGSYVGPKQAEHIFAGTGNKIINDLDDAQPYHPEPDWLRDALMGMDKVAYRPGWDDPGRAGNGTFSPKYVVMHHTGGTNSLSWLEPGGAHERVAGANFLITKEGTVYVISAFIAYHAGAGGPLGDVPSGKMNERSYGVEVESLGKEKDFTPEQMDSIESLLQRLINCMKSDEYHVINHKTWSSTGKIDTLYSDKTWQACAAGTVPPEEEIVPPEPAVDYLTQAEADRLYAPINHTHPVTGDGGDLLWSDYTGKPSESQVIKADGEWVKLNTDPLEKVPVDGREDHMMYARLNFRWKTVSGSMPTSLAALVKAVASYQGKVEAKFVRGDGDETAFEERHFTYGTQSVPFQHLHWESGERGLAGQWWIKAHGGLSSVEITTRYAKTYVIVAK